MSSAWLYWAVPATRWVGRGVALIHQWKDVEEVRLAMSNPWGVRRYTLPGRHTGPWTNPALLHADVAIGRTSPYAARSPHRPLDYSRANAD